MSGRDDSGRQARITDLTNLISEDPDSLLYLELAQLQFDDGRIADSEATLRGGIRRGIAAVEGRRQLSRVLLSSGRAEAARRLLKQVLDEQPNDEQTAITLADTLHDEGRTPEAITILRRAARRDATDAVSRRLDELSASTVSQTTGPSDGQDGHSTTSNYTAVGRNTQVEKIGRVDEPTVIIEGDGGPAPVIPSMTVDEGDGETKEGPMPLTLINQLRPQHSKNIVGKRTQTVTDIQVDDLEPTEVKSKDTVVERADLAGEERGTTERSTHSVDDAGPESSSPLTNSDKTLPGRRQSRDPQTQPNPVFKLDDSGSVSGTEAVLDGPATQRMPRVSLEENSGSGPDDVGRAMTGASSETLPKTEPGPDLALDDRGDAGNLTVRRNRKVEQPQRVPYGGADLASEGPPPTPDEYDLSENETNEFSKSSGISSQSRLDDPGGDSGNPAESTNVFRGKDVSVGANRRATPPLLESPPRQGNDPSGPARNSQDRDSSSKPPRRSDAAQPRKRANQHRGTKPPRREVQSDIPTEDRSLIRPPANPRDMAEPETIEATPRKKMTAPVERQTQAVDLDLTEPPDEGLSKWILSVCLACAALFCALSIVSVINYRSAVNDRVQVLSQQQAAVQDGNYASRTSLVTGLQEPGTAVGSWGAFANWVIGLFTTPRLVQLERARETLLVRHLYELVVIYGDLNRLDEAQRAFDSLPELQVEMDDAIVAMVLAKLHSGERESGLQMIDRLSSMSQADANWLRALFAEENEDYAAALQYAKLSVQTDADHPHAYPLYVALKAKGAEAVDALDSYRRLIEQVKPEHLSSQIEFERLRIATRKRASEAAENLRRLLTSSEQELSPRQRGLIYDGLGHHHLHEDQEDAARNAFVAATDASPEEPRFIEPLMRLHMRRFRLRAAESLLARLPDRSRVRLLPLQARLALMRGKPQRAIDLLDVAKKRTARVSFLQGMARLQLVDQEDIGERDRRRLLKEAQTHLTKARTSDEQWSAAEALLLLSRVLLGQQVSKSLSALKGLRQEDVGSGSMLLDQTLVFRAHARALLERKKYRSATNEYEVALRIDPADYQASWGLCNVYTLRLRTLDAIKACRSAMRNKAFRPARTRLAALAGEYGDHGAVIAALEGLQVKKELEASELRQLIRARLFMGQSDAVKLMLDAEGTLKAPGDKSYAQGRYALAQERIQDAQKWLSRAAELLPNDAAVQRDYGESLVRGDRSADAVSVLRRALKIDDSAVTALALAGAYLNIGEWGKARKAAQSARNLAVRTHSHPQVRANALATEAQARILEGKRSHRRKAKRSISQALAIEPGLPSGLLAKGLFLETGRRPLKAVPVYKRLTQVAPRNAQGYFRLGRLLMRSKRDRREGRSALKQARTLDPEGIWGTRANRLLRK